MRVTIRQKNLEITPALSIYIETKLLQPLHRLLKSNLGKELPILELEFGRATRHHRKGKIYHAEANLSLNGKFLRAEVDGEDIRATCDLLEEELERQILTYKTRMQALYKRGARRAKKDLRFDSAARFSIERASLRSASGRAKGRIIDEGN